jgi:hypothetical protein
MPCSFRRVSEARLARAASPTRTGMMWDPPGLKKGRKRKKMNEHTAPAEGSSKRKNNSHDGDALVLQDVLDGSGVEVLEPSVTKELLLVGDRCLSTGNNGGRKGGREDKAGSVGSDEIDHFG